MSEGITEGQNAEAGSDDRPVRRRYLDAKLRLVVELPETYKLVYQGGHHNVFCNGKHHYRTDGGLAGMNDTGIGRGDTTCDCARWNKTLVSDK